MIRSSYTVVKCVLSYPYYQNLIKIPFLLLLKLKQMITIVLGIRYFYENVFCSDISWRKNDAYLYSSITKGLKYVLITYCRGIVEYKFITLFITVNY